jgi:hypothetical protein
MIPKTEPTNEWRYTLAYRDASPTPEEWKELCQDSVTLWRYMEERDTYHLLQAIKGAPHREPPSPPYKPKDEPTVESPPLAP